MINIFTVSEWVILSIAAIFCLFVIYRMRMENQSVKNKLQHVQNELDTAIGKTNWITITISVVISAVISMIIVFVAHHNQRIRTWFPFSNVDPVNPIDQTINAQELSSSHQQASSSQQPPEYIRIGTSSSDNL